MSKIKKNISLYLLFILLMLILLGTYSSVLAAGYRIMTTIPGTTIEQGKEVKNNITLASYIGQIYLFALGIVGLVAVAAMVYWSFIYIASSANPSKMSDAMGGIKDAILGLALLLLAALILGVINPKLTTLSSLASLDVIPLNNTAPPLFQNPTWVQKCRIGAGCVDDVNFNCAFFNKINTTGCDVNTEPSPKNSPSPGSNICCKDSTSP